MWEVGFLYLAIPVLENSDCQKLTLRSRLSECDQRKGWIGKVQLHSLQTFGHFLKPTSYLAACPSSLALLIPLWFSQWHVTLVLSCNPFSPPNGIIHSAGQHMLHRLFIFCSLLENFHQLHSMCFGWSLPQVQVTEEGQDPGWPNQSVPFPQPWVVQRWGCGSFCLLHMWTNQGNTRREVGTWDRKGGAANTECVINAFTMVGYVEMILLSNSGTQWKAGPPAGERPSAKKCSPDCWDLGQVAVKWWVHGDRGWDAESTCYSLSDLVSGHLPCFSAWPKYELSFIYFWMNSY